MDVLHLICDTWENVAKQRQKQKINGQKASPINLNIENIVYYNFNETQKAFWNLPVGWNMSHMNTIKQKS